jgi:release factor glutamine methyltransferase
LLDLPASVVVERLTAAGCVAAADEAAEMLERASDTATLEEWIQRRTRGEPLAIITGSITFCSHDVLVDPGLFVPRLQSEELARRAADALPVSGRAADLCAGAGSIAVHLRRTVPGARVIGVDLDIRAARCARRNGIPCVVGDLDEPLVAGAFDVVTAVAPYVPTNLLDTLPADVLRYEPQRALDGGLDGLDVVRRVVRGAARLLKPHGLLFTEVGADQPSILEPVFAASGFVDVEVWHDQDGDARGMAARRSVRTP